MTLRIPAPSLAALEIAVWAAETARPYMQRVSASAGRQNGEWVCDLIMEEV